MKTYIIQFKLEEGCDEFWDARPSPQQVWDLLKQELGNTYLDYDDLKIVKIIDEEEYDIGEKDGKLPKNTD